MTTVYHSNAREHWRIDPEFPHIEVSNAGQVRNADTKMPVPVRGSGGKAFVQIVDHHGRRYDRNVRRLVRKLFGTAPLRITAQNYSPVEQFAEALTTTPTTEKETAVTDNNSDWIPLSWPGVIEGYQISLEGQVKSPQDEVLKGTQIRSSFGNYIVMNLRRTDPEGYVGPYRQVRLDELVLTHFIGEKPGKDWESKHLNGDTMDCRAENLEWSELVRRVVKSSPYAATPSQRRVHSTRRANAVKAGLRQERAKQLNADPDWRLVTSSRVEANSFWVSRYGKARGFQSEDLTEYVTSAGRVSVYMKLAATGNNSSFYLDELVLEAFGEGRPTPKHKVLHLNGNVSDNRAENLEWALSGKGRARPTGKPTITSNRAEVKVTTLASYRVGEVEVIVNNGMIEAPKGGTAVQQAAALAKIYAEIAKQGEQQ
jgi:hypothetical protein